jgi:nucleotide-binding universal stress UspA family protein
MHLIVPLDQSELSLSALPIARQLAQSTGAEMTLVSVAPDNSSPDATRDLAEALQAIAATVRAEGHEVHVTVRIGDVAPQIVQLVHETEADLVIMATRGRSGAGRMLLGSVSDQILGSSDVPVVLLHANGHTVEGLHTMVVAVDGTPGGALALGTAVPLARASAAELVLVRATVPLPLWLYEPTLGINTGPLIDPMWDEDARRVAETYAESLAGRLQTAGVKARGRGVSGQPAAAILSVADDVDADLIVMSTHGRTGVVRSLLGSVADEVVRQSRRPVLLVRRSPPPPTEPDATHAPG